MSSQQPATSPECPRCGPRGRVIGGAGDAACIQCGWHPAASWETAARRRRKRRDALRIDESTIDESRNR